MKAIKAPVYIIVVAAGTGSRFGADMPKQFCMLDNEPVLSHTIKRLTKAVPGAQIITVVSVAMKDYWINEATKHDTPTGIIVEGGATRWESVRNALNAISDTDADARVLVHDGARPLVDTVTVNRVLNAIEPGCSVVPVNQVTDSLRQVIDVSGNSIPVSRSDFRAVVTPQGFMLNNLKKAYELPYSPEFTDDASVMAAAGYNKTVLVNSFPSNIKITNPGDIALASWYLKHEESK